MTRLNQLNNNSNYNQTNLTNDQMKALDTFGHNYRIFSDERNLRSSNYKTNLVKSLIKQIVNLSNLFGQDFIPVIPSDQNQQIAAIRNFKTIYDSLLPSQNSSTSSQILPSPATPSPTTQTTLNTDQLPSVRNIQNINIPTQNANFRLPINSVSLPPRSPALNSSILSNINSINNNNYRPSTPTTTTTSSALNPSILSNINSINNNNYRPSTPPTTITSTSSPLSPRSPALNPSTLSNINSINNNNYRPNTPPTTTTSTSSPLSPRSPVLNTFIPTIVNDNNNNSNNTTEPSTTSSTESVLLPSDVSNIDARLEALKNKYPEIICPISHEIMRNPVIAEDGYSYERINIEQHLRQTGLSPTTGQLIGTNLITNHNLRKAIESLKENLNTPAVNDLTCPISCETMTDPVVATDGHTYERSYITQHLNSSYRSPITREIIQRGLIPNINLRNIIHTFNQELNNTQNSPTNNVNVNNNNQAPTAPPPIPPRPNTNLNTNNNQTSTNSNSVQERTTHNINAGNNLLDQIQNHRLRSVSPAPAPAPAPSISSTNIANIILNRVNSIHNLIPQEESDIHNQAVSSEWDIDNSSNDEYSNNLSSNQNQNVAEYIEPAQPAQATNAINSPIANTDAMNRLIAERMAAIRRMNEDQDDE